MRLLSALLAATLALSGQGRAQLLPASEFASRDGRPGPGKTWKLTDTQGLALAAKINAIARLTPIVIDYDHQTITAPSTGAKAPAAGWIEKVEWLSGQGLFATVKWTTLAGQYIAADEYKYLSPVIEYDEDSGEVTAVLMAALVNYPGILGMQAAEAALAAQFGHNKPRLHTESNPMNLLAQLLAMLGLPTDTNEAAALSAVVDIKAAADAAKARPVVPTALAAALELQAGATEQQAVAALSGIKAKAAAPGALSEATVAQITALQGQVQALQSAANQAQVTSLADGAIAAGKFLPAFRDELLKIGQANLAALSSMVAAAPPIPGLQGQETTGAAAAAAAANPAAALSGADAQRIAANMGIGAEAWAAQLKKAA
jgi:phage I-like protein